MSVYLTNMEAAQKAFKKAEQDAHKEFIDDLFSI